MGQLSKVAYGVAYLDIESYSPDATENNPLLKHIGGIEKVANLFRTWERETGKLISRAETEAGALAIEWTVDAADHAISNLRVAKLLDSGNW